MGTPTFAVPSLRALASGYDVVAAFTRPDARSARGSALHPSPVKMAAEELGIPVRQFSSLRDGFVLSDLRDLEPDLIVVAAFGVILPQAVLDVPRLGAVNVHASLLPRWRGAAPIQRAILAGDEVTGVSIMRMEAGLDTGPYCETVAVPVDDKSAEELTDELAGVGAEALLRALERMCGGTCVWTAQDDASATYAQKVEKSDVLLDPAQTVSEFLRQVRASSRQAPARLGIRGAGMTVLGARSSPEATTPGRVVVIGRSVVVGVADGVVELTQVKPDGKHAMEAISWARGVSLGIDATWERVG